MNGGLRRDFAGSVKICLNKYADFNGRAPRSEFWWWVLFVFLVALAAGIVAAVLDGLSGGMMFIRLARLAMFLAFVVPNLAVAVRRLHDLNKSGWWLLLGFIPAIGGLILLIFACLPGTPGANRFGADPLAADMNPAV